MRAAAEVYINENNIKRFSLVGCKVNIEAQKPFFCLVTKLKSDGCYTIQDAK